MEDRPINDEAHAIFDYASMLMQKKWAEEGYNVTAVVEEEKERTAKEHDISCTDLSGTLRQPM